MHQSMGTAWGSQMKEGPLLNTTAPRHPTDSRNLIQLPPDPATPEISTCEGDSENVEDPGLDEADDGQEG